MNDDTNVVTPVAPTATSDTVETPNPTPEQVDPIKQELDKVKGKKFTKKERLEFEKTKIEQQLSALQQEEGNAPTFSEDKNTPVTVGMLEQREKNNAIKTALELAENITDESERELTKHYLETKVKPSGNPEEDLKFARAAVNSLRNAQIAETVVRAGGAKNFSSSPGAPLKHVPVFEPTPEEAVFMQPPYNLSKDEIVKLRNKSQ